MNQTRDVRLLKVNNADPAPQPYYAQSWALVIGIDRYQDASARLANARNDAASIADLLANVYSFDHVYRLYDEEATKDTILAWLRDKLPAEVQHNDRVIIFFAGHGTSRESSSGQKRGYLIPYDAEFGRFADYVDMSELRDACGWIPAKHILIILDCCFSGIAAVTARSTPTPSSLNKLTENYIRRITERGAWQVLTAGALDELVADSGSRPGHSAFTSALLAGLQGAADQNEDGVITASDLAAFVKPEVSRETTESGGKGQIPFFSYLAGSDQGDFVLIKPGDAPRLAAPPIYEKVTPPANPLWTFGIPSIAIVILAIMGWFLWSNTRETARTRAQLTALVSTLTQEAMDFNAQQAATLAAVTDAPQSTVQAVIAEQTAAVAGTRTAIPSRISALTLGDLTLIDPTATPTPSATARRRPTPTPTPDQPQQQGPVLQAAITPESEIVAPVSQSALAAGEERTNPIDCATYLYVPAGEFEMGPDNSSQSQSAGGQYTISVEEFWIGRTEVTNSQYARCVSEGRCSSTENVRLNDPVYADHPVAHVNWQQANQYALWVGGRLPTEAEWEKAACGTAGMLYPWGDQTPDATLLNFSGNSVSGDTTPVGSFPAGASQFGLLDMAGNVQEWTSSLYVPYPYQGDDGREDANATGLRVTRGGSFIYDEYNARCSTRVSFEASYQSTDIGLRVVIDDESILTDATKCSPP